MVWSDPEVVNLSKEFIAVADEAYMLYPENPGHLRDAKNRADHNFFAKYGEQVPARDWNAQGTKQGIYMIGPNSEYLEGKFAASGEPRDIATRLKRATQAWETLRKQKGYANQPIPAAKASCPPGIQGEIIFRINNRDLPRRPGDQSGRRITAEERRSGSWPDFTKWAWNENFIGLPRLADFVPKTDDPEPVGRTSLRYIAKEALIDIVRGQNNAWNDQDIKALVLTMTRYPAANGNYRIIYEGRASMDDGRKSYQTTGYGEGIYNPDTSKFLSLEMVWTGMRAGAGTFNQRNQDPGPAPMGVTLSLFTQ